MKKAKFYLGYIFYNLIFWVRYFLHWLKRSISRYSNSLLCRGFGKCNRKESEILVKHFKRAVFLTYFGPADYEKRLTSQELFTHVTRKLGSMHRYFFGSESVQFKKLGSFSLEKTDEGVIFVGFHTVAAYRRLVELAWQFDVKKLGILVKDKATFIEKLRRNYGVRLTESKNSFELGGVTVVIFSLENLRSPASRHSKLMKLLKEGASLFINYDIPTSREELIPNILDDRGNPKDSSKYVVFRYDQKKLLISSNYLLYLLKRSHVSGVPVFTRRLNDGRDLVILGSPLSIEPREKIGDKAQEIYRNLFSFMSKNILASSHGWVNASNLARLMPFLRKPNSAPEEEWRGCGEDRAAWKLSSHVFVSRYDGKSYLITSSSPINSIKAGSFTKKVISEMKTNGTVSPQFKERVPRKKLETTMANLWEAGFIEKTN